VAAALAAGKASVRLSPYIQKEFPNNTCNSTRRSSLHNWHGVECEDAVTSAARAQNDATVFRHCICFVAIGDGRCGRRITGNLSFRNCPPRRKL
jgi:hypothetical protein